MSHIVIYIYIYICILFYMIKYSLSYFHIIKIVNKTFKYSTVASMSLVSQSPCNSVSSDERLLRPPWCGGHKSTHLVHSRDSGSSTGGTWQASICGRSKSAPPSAWFPIAATLAGLRHAHQTDTKVLFSAQGCAIDGSTRRTWPCHKHSKSLRHDI